MKILAIDDNIINLKLITEFLSKEHEVIESTNGLDAIKIINKESIDLILLDLLMPIMDGKTFLRKIKNDINYNEIPVIIITAFTDSYNIRECIQLGAEDYVKKPIDYTELINKIDIVEKKIDIRSKTKEIEKEYNIYNSLKLAENFQTSMLPDKLYLKNLFKDFLTMYLPVDYVSGDIYNINKLDGDRIIISLFDLIGHGIPASMMSIFVNTIANKNLENYTHLRTYTSNIIKDVKKYMNLNDTFVDLNFDATLIELRGKKLKSIGIHTPFIIVRKSGLNLKCNDKIEIPIYSNEKYSIFKTKGSGNFLKLDCSYKMNEIDLMEGDIVYLYSDGYLTHLLNDKYIDKTIFYENILNWCELDMIDQKKLFYESIEKYKKNLIDDITIIGFKI